MTLRGFDGGRVRPPLCDLDDAALAEVREVVERLSQDGRAGFRQAA